MVKKRKAVVVDSGYGSVTQQELEDIKNKYAEFGIELEILDLHTEQEIIDHCPDAVAILGTGNPPITRAVIEQLPELKFVQRFGIGVNSIDLQAATDHGVIVFNLPGFCVEELADLACAMIMGLIRNTAYYDRHIRNGEWPKCCYYLPGNIRKMTLGIYGFGGAGKCLAEIFTNGFGTRVLACDPYASKQMVEECGCTMVDFDTLLEQSDIISLHAPLTKETEHIFNRDAFLKMKSSAMLINTSRGKLIDEKDLIWALQRNEIRYAGLDTFEEEPVDRSNPLLMMDNVILSPHSGSYGSSAKEQQHKKVCELIPQALCDKKLQRKNVANRNVIELLADEYVVV